MRRRGWLLVVAALAMPVSASLAANLPRVVSMNVCSDQLLLSLADPEQILVSNAVAELCLGKALAFKDLGRVALKGFEQPIHVHSLAFQAA